MAVGGVGAVLEELFEDPWSVGHDYGSDTPARFATFGLAGRGMVLFMIYDEEPRHVLLVQIPSGRPRPPTIAA